MANLNDVLRDVLEKDFDKDTVDRRLMMGTKQTKKKENIRRTVRKSRKRAM